MMLLGLALPMSSAYTAHGADTSVAADSFDADAGHEVAPSQEQLTSLAEEHGSPTSLYRRGQTDVHRRQEEVLEEDEDDITGIGNHSDTVKRREDSMLALSGAQGTYLEYHTRARG